MYTFDFFSRLLSLDLAWFAWLFFANIYYIFMYTVVVFAFFNPKGLKKWAVAFFILTFMLWFSLDFVASIGWVLFVSAFFWIHYVSKVAVVSFCEADPKLRNHLPIINNLQYIAILIIFNLILVNVM